MSCCDTHVACVSTSYNGASAKTTEGASYEEPPPYSACVSYSPTSTSSYPATHSSLPVNPSAYPPNGIHYDGYTTGNIQHKTTSRAQFSDVTRGLENCRDAYIPRQNEPTLNVHGTKTIVLQRTDCENITRRRKKIIALFILILISSVVPIAVISVFFVNRAKFL